MPHLQPGPGFFARIPKWALITAPTLLVAVACVAVYLYLQGAKVSAQSERFENIVATANSESPAGTPEDIKILGDFIEDPEYSAIAANAMIRLEGEGLDAAMITLLGKTKEEIGQINLLKALAERRAPEAFSPVKRFVESKRSKVEKGGAEYAGCRGGRKRT